MKLVLVAISVILAVTSTIMSSTLSTEQEILQYSSYPNLILQEIQNRGARVVVNELYDSDKDWQQVLEQIQSGSVDWLRVAVALHPGSDAGSSEMLGEAVGIALIQSPENVLRITIPSFRLEVVCGGRQDPLPTYEEASSELERQVAAVKQMQNEEVTPMRNRCLEQLDKARTNLKRFFEIK